MSDLIAQEQQKTLLIFDLETSEIDSLVDLNFDESIEEAATSHYIGSFNSDIASLSEEPPIDDIYPGTQFTRKVLVSSEFDLTSYPIRTSLKLFGQADDTLNGYCSASLVSKRHVLTAAHCVSNLGSNELFYDDFYVSPVYDEGEHSSIFPGSYVSKVFLFKDWNLNGWDLALLELEEPIGELVGWVGIGFNFSDNILEESLFHKFSYPNGNAVFANDPFPDEYDGQNLYYAFGRANTFTEDQTIGITGTYPRGNESGSSLIKLINEQEYVTYGALSGGQNRHSRLNRYRYYFFESIIADHLNVESKDISELVIFPNPTKDKVWLKNIKKEQLNELRLFDSLGRLCLAQARFETEIELNLSELPAGIYLLKIITMDSNITKKVIKR